MSIDTMVARRDRLLGRHAELFYERPLNLVRGEGACVFDADGRRYIDMYNNIPVVGHCNPRVVNALARQAATLVTHSRYLDETILDYAERLLGVHADGIDRVVFTCTGTEANEVAMQMARLASGGRGFICTNAAYHGNSDLVGTLTDAPLRGRAGVRAFRFPDLYRPLEPGLSESEVCERAVGEVRSAIDDLAADGVPLAGMLLCSILANEGLPWIPAGFMEQAAAIVREAGGVVIFDEVQAGFCRTGRFWGYESTGVVPDIVTMGKPMGNGYPLAGLAARADIVDAFGRERRYFNTFAGTPVACAAGLAVLDVLAEERLVERAGVVGSQLLARLRPLAALPAIRDVRGVGLFVAVETTADADASTSGRSSSDAPTAATVVDRMREQRVLAGVTGPGARVVKIRPPLAFSEAEIEPLARALERALGVD